MEEELYNLFRTNWESGSPDYMGTASFTNILKKISKSVVDAKIVDEEELVEK